MNSKSPVMPTLAAAAGPASVGACDGAAVTPCRASCIGVCVKPPDAPVRTVQFPTTGTLELVVGNDDPGCGVKNQVSRVYVWVLHVYRLWPKPLECLLKNTCTSALRGLGWRIHESVEDTKLSTNKQHTLSLDRYMERGQELCLPQQVCQAEYWIRSISMR